MRKRLLMMIESLQNIVITKSVNANILKLICNLFIPDESQIRLKQANKEIIIVKLLKPKGFPSTKQRSPTIAIQLETMSKIIRKFRMIASFSSKFIGYSSARIMHTLI